MSRGLGFLLKKLAVLSDLAQIWPKLVHLKACKSWHYVSSALEMPMTLKKNDFWIIIDKENMSRCHQI